MMTVKFFFSAKLKLISDNWEFISANALSLLRVTGAGLIPRLNSLFVSALRYEVLVGGGGGGGSEYNTLFI